MANEATAEIVAGLMSEGWDTAGNPVGIDDPSWGSAFVAVVVIFVIRWLPALVQAFQVT